MELYKNTANEFVNYLIRHGYPEDCIVFEWGTKKCAVDVVIVADDLKTPIAAFEIKGVKSNQTITNGISQMKRAAELLSLSVPMSLVFGTNQKPFFQIVDISDIVYREEEMTVEEIMSTEESSTPIAYKFINSSALGKKMFQKEEYKKDKMDCFGKVCWILMPIFSAIILVLDAIQFYTLTTERLVVLGSLLVVILLPFFSEFSWGDFSAKRNKGIKK